MIFYIFAVSFVIVFGILSLKIFEVRRKKRTRFSLVLTSFDSRLRRKFEEAEALLDHGLEESGNFIKQDVPRQAKYALFILKKEIKEKYDAFALNLRGSRILRKNGDVSSFLKDIAKYK